MFIDWMHDIARCLGYPSDSSRAAREWARETSCGRHPRRAGQARPVGYSPSAIGPGPCGWCRWRRTHQASTRLWCAALLASHSYLLQSASGIAHQPLALGRLPGCSSACRIAAPYRHCRPCWCAVGWVRTGTLAGGSPSAPYCLRDRRHGAGPRFSAVLLPHCFLLWPASGIAH
jgi:hypothetical protein